MRNFVELTVYEAVGFNTSYTYPFTAGFGGKNIGVSEFTTNEYPEVTAKITTGVYPRRQEFWVGGMSFQEIIDGINSEGNKDIDFIISYGDIRFNENRVYGSELNYTGDIVIDPASGLNGKIALVYHNDTVVPVVSSLIGSPIITIKGTYILNTNHAIYLTPTYSGVTLTAILVEITNLA